MSEIVDTFSKYLGPEFQMNLMWQLLVEPEFCDKTINNISVDYFDDPFLKRLFLYMKEYYKEFEKSPNLQNDSIIIAINKYKGSIGIIELESILAIITKIRLLNDNVNNGIVLHSGDAIQKETNFFIKQQEYRVLGEFILDKAKSGDIKNKYIITEIEEKIEKIVHIGDEEDYGIDVFDNIENVFRKDFRETIPTGITVIDAVTGGGLGKGEVGLILAPGGVGKTTILSIIANSAHAEGKKVLQIIMEDTDKQIQRKHSTIWSGIKLSELEEREEEAIRLIKEKHRSIKNGGKLLIKHFSQEDTTMVDIRKWIIKYQKKVGYKFDIVILDYLDCVNSHKKAFDKNESELVVVKSFLALASDFDIPCWSALQGNRGSYSADFLNVNEMGGSIKRYQKAHFFMSVAKPEEQKDTRFVNTRILKARFAQDGQSFKESILDNDQMIFILNDDTYGNKYTKAIPKLSDSKKEQIDNLAMEIKMRNDAEKINIKPSIYVTLNDSFIPESEIASETIGDKNLNMGKFYEPPTEDIIVKNEIIKDIEMKEEIKIINKIEPVLDNINNEDLLEILDTIVDENDVDISTLKFSKND
jgi:RecA/RadA recombinase